MPTNAELIAAARQLQTRTAAVPIPAFYGASDQTPRGTVPVNRKAFDDVLTVLSALNGVSPTIIDGGSADAVAQLAAALAGDATLIMLTGVFTLVTPLAVKRGWRRVYLVNATLNATLAAANRGLFEMEEGTFLDIATRNSDINLTGTGGGNSIFRPATENFTLHVDGGAFSGIYESDLTYTGTNSRCIKTAGAQTDELLPAHFIAVRIIGSGVGEQFTDTGTPRLHVSEVTNCHVTSNYLNVDTSSRNGFGFGGKQLYVNRSITYLQAIINGPSVDGGPCDDEQQPNRRQPGRPGGGRHRGGCDWRCHRAGRYRDRELSCARGHPTSLDGYGGGQRHHLALNPRFEPRGLGGSTPENA